MKKKAILDPSGHPPSRRSSRRLTTSDRRTSPGPFRCASCSLMVYPERAGSQHRNHCPHCLHSLHLDIEPGDREAHCGSVMEPIAVWVRQGREWCLIHRCRGCGTLSSNRIAADDNSYILLSLAAKPLALPPFPLDRRVIGEEEGQNLA